MNKNTQNILLVLSVVLVLAAGIYAVTKVLGGKKDDVTYEGTDGEDKPPVGGRLDPSLLFTDEELQRNTLEHKGIAPDYQPVLADSPQGKEIIENIVRDIQTGNEEGLTFIRGREEIGYKLLSIPSFTEEANAAIRQMFSYMPPVVRGKETFPVDPDNPSTWPIYGKYEANGKALRRDLEDFLDIPIERLHLGPAREENAGWLPSIGLNIMMLTTVNRLPTIYTIRGDWATGDDRLGLINYKRINGFTATHEKYLAKLVPGNGGHTSPYKAYGTRRLAEVILEEMDRLDNACRLYAKKKAIGDGRVIEQATASDTSTDTTTTNTNPISTKAGANKIV